MQNSNKSRGVGKGWGIPPSWYVRVLLPSKCGEGVVDLTVVALNPAASNNGAQTVGLLEGTGIGDGGRTGGCMSRILLWLFGNQSTIYISPQEILIA